MSDYPVIPELPDPPLRTDGRVDFARKGSVFLGAFPAMRTAFNDAGAWVQTTLATIFGYKNAAEQAASDAQGYANSAGNSALDASGYAANASNYSQIANSAANFAGEWGDLTGSLSIPASVYHGGAYWVLLRNLADVTLSEPGVSSDWASIDTNIIAWQAINTNTALISHGRYAVNFSGGALELTLPPSPANNDVIEMYRSAGSAVGSTVKANGNTIMGSGADLSINTEINHMKFIYNGSDWRVTAS